MSCTYTFPIRLTTSAPSLSVLTPDSLVINHDISLSWLHSRKRSLMQGTFPDSHSLPSM